MAFASTPRVRKRRITHAEDIIADSDSDFSDYTDNESDSSDDDGINISSTLISNISDDGNGSSNWQPHDGQYIPLWCPQYSKRQGILFSLIDKHPVQYFYQLFHEEAFEMIADHTNNYALQFLDGPIDFGKHSRYIKWQGTTTEEIKAYVGLQILMGVISKPKIEDYWALGDLDASPGFRSVMSRNRFQLLNTFIHFCDNEERIPRGQAGYDPLYKISPLITLLNPLARQSYIPHCQLSVDETMRRFKGRIFFRQYMPNKPIRWGIKVWSLCECKTGYLLDYKVYTGKEHNPVDKDKGLGYNVVVGLLEDDFLNCGHHVYMDNFYSSPHPFDALQQLNTGACGTVRVTRKHMPSSLKPANLKLKKGDDPVFMRKGNLLACTWQDTARVNFLSNIDGAGRSEKEIRHRHSLTGFRSIQKPNVAINYNASMGGVDLFDQKCATHQYPHKVKKWYHAIYHFLKEAALVNAFILYQLDNPHSLLGAAAFRRKVAQALCSTLLSNPNAYKVLPVLNPRDDKPALDVDNVKMVKALTLPYAQCPATKNITLKKTLLAEVVK
ncbi:piggyBac transposable element-derived protein 4-like [Watersipora subatra]|uniref:piggyBac transposable element-derived protein 4-like n=1 Tax=Watersipora subatra TaxID=2589382 RepID=UPI00355C04AF